MSKYGEQETNPMVDPRAYHDAFPREPQTVPWTEKGLYVTRLRLIGDHDAPPGWDDWDVSYCHGRLDGEQVRVQLPFHQLPRRNYRRAIVQYAKRDGVFARGIGILENISTLR